MRGRELAARGVDIRRRRRGSGGRHPRPRAINEHKGRCKSYSIAARLVSFAAALRVALHSHTARAFSQTERRDAMAGQRRAILAPAYCTELSGFTVTRLSVTSPVLRN